MGSNDGYLLYISDTSVGTSVKTNVVNSATGAIGVPVTSARSRGVKLVNGGTLPDAGLTIVSPNPVYIQGDYNTGSTHGVEAGFQHRHLLHTAHRHAEPRGRLL